MHHQVDSLRLHKERNVTDHLPKAERPLIQRRLRSAWANPDPQQARAELEALARSLARQRPGAAASLREGLAETLTVNRLGVGGKLLQTLESTNPFESLQEEAFTATALLFRRDAGCRKHPAVSLRVSAMLFTSRLGGATGLGK